MDAATNNRPSTAWQRYRPWKPVFEIGFWVGLYLFNGIAGGVTSLMDVHSQGLRFADWEPAVWEGSSNLMALALVPALVWFTRRMPMHFDTWRRALRWHLLASVVWSALHVAGMVAIRKLIYMSLGDHYDFGPWLRGFGYEYLKDVRSYATVVMTIEGYRLLMRRWQGEASVLAGADGEAAPGGPTARPERFLVRKLGKEFLIAASDVEWLQAAGNYVNLHLRGRDYPLRATMAAIEDQLDPARFTRVHRSYMVNLDRIAQIEPLDTGDARIVMDDGVVIPCSRRYRDALRPAMRAA
ncbi:MAG: lytTr DNA-binding domain protein [Xanthomonadaceae bacterium]|nr:lytTr DNA-binding domain protein [Xanthomonadaceae bacterium]